MAEKKKTRKQKPLSRKIKSAIRNVWAVLCYWEYDVDTERWEFVEAIPINDDGRPLLPIKYKGDYFGSRYPQDDFLYKKVFWPPEHPEESGFVDDDGLEEQTPIPGRLVVICNFEDGVRLQTLNYPAGAEDLASSSWLKPYSTILKDNWTDFLNDGYRIKRESAIHARKLFGVL